jgi:hypothetical protein
VTESVIGADKIWTDKYKDTVHVVLQSLDAGIVVALSFFPVKSPERVSTPVEIAYHAQLLARIIGDRVTFSRVINHFLLPLWWLRATTYLDYGLPRVQVVLEFPHQTERSESRCILLVLGFVW